MSRLVLFTDEPIVAAGLELVLAGSDVDLVETATAISQLEELISSHSPDVALIDSTPEMTFESISSLHTKFPACKIVVWARQVSVEVAHHLVEAGVSGILKKQLPKKLIVVCLTKVADGEIWMERPLIDALLRAKSVNLSNRERQLLRLICCGYSNKHIASELFLSEGTVKVYLSRLFRKTNVSDRFELALYGLRHCKFTFDTALERKSAGASEWPTSLVRLPGEDVA